MLVGLGPGLVTGRPVLSRVGGRVPDGLVRRIPVVSAVVVAGLGTAMAVVGIGQHVA